MFLIKYFIVYLFFISILGPVGESSAQKYIEVGGGPKSLPQKYHTVIDLPSRRSMKKSPMGWKSIFKPKSNQKNGQKNRHTIDLINSQVQYLI